MSQTWNAPERCPVCGHDHLLIARLRCPVCESAVEGSFEPYLVRTEARPSDGSRQSGPLPGARDDSRFGRLVRLSDEQLEFVEVFLRCRGVIKNVEDMLGISYPTVRGRLNAVLDTLGLASEDDGSAVERRRMRREILADLSAQRISAEDALELLARTPAAADEDGDNGEDNDEDNDE